MEDLLDRWCALVGGTDAAGRDLLARWSEPHRAYHDTDHLRAILDAIDTLAGHADDPAVVELAAWFHDAVYDGAPGDDERASASLAADVMAQLDMPPHRVDEVVRLVLLTATHDPMADDHNGAVLCDADLAVLGSEPDEYAAYAANVRAEYSHVSDADFRAGRAAVLHRLLATEPLYRTSTARERWETTARGNLTTELALLSVS